MTACASPVHESGLIRRAEFNGARELFSDFIFNRGKNLKDALLHKTEAKVYNSTFIPSINEKSDKIASQLVLKHSPRLVVTPRKQPQHAFYKIGTIAEESEPEEGDLKQYLLGRESLE